MKVHALLVGAHEQLDRSPNGWFTASLHSLGTGRS